MPGRREPKRVSEATMIRSLASLTTNVVPPSRKELPISITTIFQGQFEPFSRKLPYPAMDF